MKGEKHLAFGAIAFEFLAIFYRHTANDDAHITNEEIELSLIANPNGSSPSADMVRGLERGFKAEEVALN